MKTRAFPGSTDHIRVSVPSERGEDMLVVKIPQVERKETMQTRRRVIVDGKNATEEEKRQAIEMVEKGIKKWQCLSCGAGNENGIDKCYACGNSREELERLVEEEAEMDAIAADRAKEQAYNN